MKAYCGNGFTMFLSVDGELYSCGSVNSQDTTDVLLHPEKVNITYCTGIYYFFNKFFLIIDI